MGADGAAEPEVVLRLDRITKRFGPLTANDQIGFEVRRGEVVGLLGENGAGKTTLMNILFGHYVADEGAIEAFGRPLPAGSPHAAIAAGIGMVHQHFTLAENLTVLDNILLGTEPLWRWRSDSGVARRKLRRLSKDFGLEVNPDARVGELSVGERQRTEILKALYREARILILDEPTAVLTPQESTALFGTLKKLVAQGLSIIFISHKLAEVLEACHRILVLRAGRLIAERAPASTSRAELAQLMVGREISAPRIEPQAAGEAHLRLSGVTVRGPHGQAVLDDIALAVHGGEIVGVAGVSGNGQTALADLICGLQQPSAGAVTLFGEAIGAWRPRTIVERGVARIPEDRHAVGLIGDMSVTENAVGEIYRQPAVSRRGLIAWQAARGFAERIIGDYDVKCPSPGAAVRLLSGGNMQKLILGRVLSQAPRFILANQPTRGLDVGAVSYVHAQLLGARRAGGSVLLISEDLDEILALADRIVVIHRGRLSAPMARAGISIEQLGLMMAGHGLEREPHAA
jgi:general nucleoside transport system ATP-binding protein